MSKKTGREPQPAKLVLDSYPGLNGLSYYIGYLEQLLAVLSEPLLIGCASLAVIDFITGGGLLSLPAIMYIWAGSLAIAVSACFIVTWRRAIKAFTLNYYGTAFWLALLGSALGLVDWSAVDVQSLQQTLGVSFISALSALNVNIVVITHIRSAVAIAMAIVVAISNHTAVTTAQAPKRRIAKLDQWLNKIAPVVNDQQEQATTQPKQEPSIIVEEEQPAPMQIEEKSSSILHWADIAPVDRVRNALKMKPKCSDRELGRLAHMAPLTAKKYRAVVVHADQDGQQTA